VRKPSKWSVLGIVGTGVFMCTLDSSIVNVSLPAIAKHFGAPVGAEVEWVIIAYLVVIASTLLTVGRLADRIGHRPIWLSGLAVFTVGSALCGAAPTLWLLICARVLQGIGGSLLMAVSPAMLTSAFPPEERGRALGLNSTIVALGISAGPALGGWITETASWRWIFYVNVPIGIAGAIATMIVLPGQHEAARSRFDVAGAVLLGIALASLATLLSIGADAGWTSPVVLGLAAVAIVTGALFTWQERRAANPLLEHRLFQNRLFAWASASLVLSFLAGFAVSFLLPIYFEQLRGFSLARTGLLLTAFPLVVAVVAPISGALADRIGTRGLASAGMTVLCAGLLLLARLGEHTSIWGVIWPQLVAALGMALFQSPNNSAIMGAAPRDRQGVAAGMLATGRTMGQSLSVAIAGAVFVGLGAAAAGRALLGHPHDPALSATFLHGFQWALRTCAALSAAAIVTSLLRGSERDHSESSSPASGPLRASRISPAT
jgi:EmrB/QacA subfamily drug resistance transporter